MQRALIFEDSEESEDDRPLYTAAESVEMDVVSSMNDYSTSSNHYHGKHTNAHVTLDRHHDDVEEDMAGLSAAAYTEIAKKRVLASSWALVTGQRDVEREQAEVVYGLMETS